VDSEFDLTRGLEPHGQEGQESMKGRTTCVPSLTYMEIILGQIEKRARFATYLAETYRAFLLQAEVAGPILPEFLGPHAFFFESPRLGNRIEIGYKAVAMMENGFEFRVFAHGLDLVLVITSRSRRRMVRVVAVAAVIEWFSLKNPLEVSISNAMILDIRIPLRLIP
jgi:hypothetical protein